MHVRSWGQCTAELTLVPKGCADLSPGNAKCCVIDHTERDFLPLPGSPSGNNVQFRNFGYDMPTTIQTREIMMPIDTKTREAENLIEPPNVAVDDLSSRTSIKDEESHGLARRTRGPLVSWWLEGLAIVVSLLLLAAIVGLLYHFDGKEQPEWPYWINLNTVVATLSTILRAQLLLVAAEGQLHSSSSLC